MIETHTVGRQLIQLRSPILLTAVGPQAFVSQIVRHNQDDVRLSGRLVGIGADGKGRNGGQENGRFHALQALQIGEWHRDGSGTFHPLRCGHKSTVLPAMFLPRKPRLNLPFSPSFWNSMVNNAFDGR